MNLLSNKVQDRKSILPARHQSNTYLFDSNRLKSNKFSSAQRPRSELNLAKYNKNSNLKIASSKETMKELKKQPKTQSKTSHSDKFKRSNSKSKSTHSLGKKSSKNMKGSKIKKSYSKKK